VEGVDEQSDQQVASHLHILVDLLLVLQQVLLELELDLLVAEGHCPEVDLDLLDLLVVEIGEDYE